MRNILYIIMLVLSPLLVSAQIGPQTDTTLVIQEGVASYYGRIFHNRRTANGEVFDMEGFTAAHKNLPFGTMVRVTNKKNGKEVIVKINDRLPQNSKRTIDLARGAAKQIGMIQMGLAPVQISLIEPTAVADLRGYYQDNKPETMRLRDFSDPVIVEKDSSTIFTLTHLIPETQSLNF